MEDSFLPYILATSAYDFFSCCIKWRISTFSLMGSTSQLLLGFEELPASLPLLFGAIIKQNQGLFSQQDCNSAATNADSENTRG
jgi:hypothetical protein